MTDNNEDLKKSKELLDSIINAGKSYDDLLKSANKEWEKNKKSLEKINEAFKQNNKLLIDGKETQVSSSELRKAEFEILLEQVAIKKNILELEYKTRIEEEKAAGASKERLEELKKLYDLELDELENDENRNKLAIRNNDLAIGFGKAQAQALSSFTGIGKESNTILGKMIQLKGEGVDFSHSFNEVKEQILLTLTPANLLAAAVDKIGSAIKGIINLTIDFAKEQDKAYAKFEKEAGNVKKYQDQISQLRLENGRYGVSIADAGEQLSAFKTQFAGFDSMSKSQQTALATTSAQLSKLGVATQDVVKTQEMLIKGMGMSVTESTNLQKSLYGTAQAMGLPPKQVAADFAKSAPQLAAHGKNMTKVFLDLQNNAKNTGIEFNRLLAITSKFDTFEGAADSAGQLNAILGGDYLNSIQLLNADEGERVRLMQEALKASGKSYEAMSKQERMAAAQAMGLSDVTELQKLMNNETTKGTVETMNAQKAQEEMNKSIQSATELGEAFKSLLSKLVIEMRPIIERIKEIVMGITGWLDKHPALSKVLGAMIIFGGILAGIIAAIAIAFISVGSAINGARTIFGAGGQAISNTGRSAGSAMRSIAGGIRTIGNAAKNSKSGILALGAAFLMIGGGIALAAFGLAELVKAFAGLTGPQILGALGALIIAMLGFTAIVVALGIAMIAGPGAAAVGGLLALGAAFLMIGAGIAIAALGLSVLVKSFAGLGENAMPAALAVASLAGAMVLITYALIAAIPSTLAAGAAFAAAAPGILAFGAAVALIGVGIGVAAAGIGYMAKSVGDMFTALSKSDPKNISASFEALFDSLSITGVAKFASFASAADNLADSLDGINKNLSSMITKVSLINSLDFSPKINASPKMQTGAAVTNTVSTATAAATANNITSGGGSTTNIVPVAVYLDNKKIGEILDPKIKQTIQDSLKNINSKTVAVGI